MKSQELYTSSSLINRGKAIRLSFGDTGLRLENYLLKDEWLIHYSPGGSINTASSMSEKARRSNLLCRGLYCFWEYSRTAEGEGVFLKAGTTKEQETNLENALAFSSLFERNRASNIVSLQSLAEEALRTQRRAIMTFNIKAFISLPSNEKVIDYLRRISEGRAF